MRYSEEEYNCRLDELFARSPSVQNAGFTPGSYKPGLDGMMKFDSAMGHPWKKFKCIHVAGTNGKGSVSSMIAASLSALGFRVGLYTSPHLLDFRERMKVVGESMISREEVWEFLETFNCDGLSFFEITTGMAFWWFADKKVDYAVIEVGLGGRLDSTNIITPALSVVTSIGLDHCALLGSTRSMIASEKAGIFKKDIPALVWGHDTETDIVFENKASESDCPLFYADIDTADGIESDLTGEYQQGNIATAIKALGLLGFPLSDTVLDALKHTAERTGLRGRWEKLCRNPLTICDIGHNPAALRINLSSLEKIGRPLVIVYGVMADKDIDSIIPLMPADAHYILVAPATPRAMKADELFSRIRSARPELDAEPAESVREGIEQARSYASPDSVIYIGGSTFVVCEALPLYNLDV